MRGRDLKKKKNRTGAAALPGVTACSIKMLSTDRVASLCSAQEKCKKLLPYCLVLRKVLSLVYFTQHFFLLYCFPDKKIGSCGR